MYLKKYHPAESRRERPRIDSDTRLLIAGAQCVAREGKAFICDAYYGLARPLRLVLDVGLEYPAVDYNDAELDHIWPYSKEGNDEVGNYQYLAKDTNTFGYTLNGKRFPQKAMGAELGKGNRILLHSQYVGMICDEKVNVRDFAEGWKRFLEEFQATGKFAAYWPFWLRELTPPLMPIAPGWNGRSLDRRAAFRGDWQRRAMFARIFLRHTRPEVAAKYRDIWAQKIGWKL